MERISCDIEEDVGDIVDDEDENMDLDRIGIVRSMESREDRFLSDRLDGRSAREDRSSRARLDDDIFSSCQVISPAHIREGIVECVEVDDLCIRDLDIDSIRESASDKETIEDFEWTLSTYEPVLSCRLGESEPLTLTTYEGLESWLTSEGDMDIFSIVWRAILLFRCVRDDFHGVSIWESREL